MTERQATTLASENTCLHPKTIGLMVDGGGGWWGRLEYTKNIAAALREWNLQQVPECRVRVLAVSMTKIKPDIEAYLQEHVDGFVVSRQPRGPLILSKILGRLKRVAWKLKIPARGALDKVVQENRIEFLYPSFEDVCPNSCRSAAWIPDFQHLHLPALFSKHELRMRDVGFKAIARKAPAVVLSSESAAADFRNTYGAKGKPPFVLPFRVTPPTDAINADFQATVDKYHLPDRYLIICNQFWQHKNHSIVFQALSRLKQEGVTVQLVCTGRLHDHRQEDFSDQVLAEINLLGIADQVRLLGLIPKQDQMQLLRGSVALVQPSLFEGWNTGIEESLALGIPVIASDIPVHREQCGKSGRYAPVDNADKWESQLRSVWSETADSQGTALHYQNLRHQFAETFLKIAAGSLE